METRIFYDNDADLNLITGRKIAIIGYGAQGAAHARNLRDSGCDVVVGQRSGGPGFELAQKHGFEPVSIASAADSADIVNLLLPDEIHGEVFETQVSEHLEPGNIVMTCHGFSFHYGLVQPPDGVDRLLVAPKGQGHMVRGEFENGGGVPCLVATDESARPETLQIGLAYAKALGGTRAGVLETTIKAETETDLFGEQAVLCGGLTALVQAGYDTLVEAGYQKELAYFECLHELKIIIDLLHRGGLTEMRELISNTAEYGDYTQGPKIIDQHVRDKMKSVLADIQDGSFARAFMEQQKLDNPTLKEERNKTRSLEIERVGTQLRAMMPWLQQDGGDE